MNYMLLYFGAFAWMLTGGLFVYIAQLRKTNERLEVENQENEAWAEHWRLAYDEVEKDFYTQSLRASNLTVERDNAHKMLEFVLSDENLKELSK